jgi:DNA-binding transcriptional LysR family regulator
MTLRQFEAFLAVAKAKSFRRAAETMHLSQPALSQHIRELEEEFGIPLFDRLGRSVGLTAGGRVLQEHALRLFTTLDDARAHVAALVGLKRGSLLVGASTTPGIYVLPRLLSDFSTRCPGIQVSLRIGNSRVIEESVEIGEVDLGVIGGHVLGRNEKCRVAGLHDELVLVVPPRHRWGSRRDVDPAQLADEGLLVREEGSATREVTERTLRQHGIEFKILMELGHVEAIKQAVMAGMGAAFLSIHAIQAEAAAGRLHTVRVRGLPIRRHFHVIHNAQRTLPPAAQAFMEILETAA